MWDPKGPLPWLSPPFSPPPTTASAPAAPLLIGSTSLFCRVCVWGGGGWCWKGGVTRWPQGWTSPRCVQRYSCKQGPHLLSLVLRKHLICVRKAAFESSSVPVQFLVPWFFHLQNGDNKSHIPGCLEDGMRRYLGHRWCFVSRSSCPSPPLS